LHDVARSAGVSIATVSRALSQPDTVRKETRDRVLQVIQETGYRTNQVAVQLRTGTSRSLMVLVSDITNAFYAEFFKGIEDYARSRGYIILIGDTSEDPSSEQDYFDLLSSKKADGLLWNVDATPQVLATDSRTLPGTPLVLCNANDRIDAPTVRIDNDLGGRLAAEHLIGLGHRRVAQVCGPIAHDSIARRYAGFTSELAKSGCSVPDDLTFAGKLGIELGRDAAEQIARHPDPPTAVFAHNDVTAIGLLHTLLNRGLRVPDDISLVGYDDMPYAPAMTPDLTTVRLPRRRWGAAACKMLIDVIERNDVGQTEIIIAPELKVRGSSAPPRSMR